MTREAGATRRVANRMREHPRSPLTPRLVHAGTMSWGLGSSRPWTSSLLTSLGQVARNGTRRGRLEGCRDRRRGRPNPGSRPKPGNLRSLGKDLTCWSPSHPPNYGPSSGPIGLSPAQGRTYATCFLPVKSVDGYEELFSAVGRRLGISQSIYSAAYLSTSLTNILQRDQVCGAERSYAVPPTAASCFPHGGKVSRPVDLVLDRKGPGPQSVPGTINDHDQRH